MKPSDLGLPAKFVDWRVGQDDAIIDTADSLLNSGKRFYVSSQPTGAGKSAYVMGVSRIINAKRTLVLTITKSLQDQYINDFASMGMVEIRGQGNYQCLAVQKGGELEGHALPNIKCDEGPCHAGVECSLRQVGCTYFDATRRASKAEIVVTNYDYWMSINKHGDEPIGVFDFLVLDEAHDAPDKLSEFVSIQLSTHELDDLIGSPLPPLDAGLEYWAHWSRERLSDVEHELSALKESKSNVSKIKRLRNLGSKLEDLSVANRWKRGDNASPNVWIPGSPTDWVAEQFGNVATFSPVWAHGYAESFLFAGIPKVLLTSATIIPKTISYLGASEDDFTYSERKSTFPVLRRPIYTMAGVKVGSSMSRGEEMIWMNKIDRILSERMDRKVIIHAVSYARAKFIAENSRYTRFMHVHGTKDVITQVEKFRRARAPAILVSPSVRTGWDFAYDQCEVQIIAKIPFVDLRPAVIQARSRSDKSYTNYLAIMSLIQSAGRGMRAADDMCETFIVDDNIRWLLQAGKKMVPKWFKMAVQEILDIPTPPARLLPRR